MAYDKVVDSAKLDAAMTATANAIRAKRGSAGMIAWDEQNGYAGAVNALPDAIEEVEQATPSISVSSGGLITASATQEAGKVAAGTKSATKQLTTQGAKTVTPTTSEQVAVAAGVYTTGEVKVAAITITKDERAEARERLLWIMSTDIYAAYCEKAKIQQYTVKMVAESWSPDSIYNNPTTYPTETYVSTVNSIIDSLDAYAASAGVGGSWVTGSVSRASTTSIVISGLPFSEIKSVHIASGSVSTSGAIYGISVSLHDGKYYTHQYKESSSAYIECSYQQNGLSIYNYTYSNGTLTISGMMINFSGSTYYYTIWGV